MLKKNQVDAHAGRCRRCDSVSCVDCSVSFWGGKCVATNEKLAVSATTSSPALGIPPRIRKFRFLDRRCHWEDHNLF